MNTITDMTDMLRNILKEVLTLPRILKITNGLNGYIRNTHSVLL